MSKQIEPTRIGLAAIKSLLSRDPCIHANTAIQMIDAMLAEQPAQQDSPWCMKMNGCKTKCEDCPDEAPKIGCVNHDCDQCEALAEQPAQQEPVAEVKAKTTGGNVGIATAIHEIHSPLREPLQPGDRLYAAYRWIGWDVEQVWSERIFGIDMRFENVQDAIAFREKLDEATTPQAQPAREPLKRATIADARDYLNTNDKAMWVLGWNECVEAHGITKGNT